MSTSLQFVAFKWTCHSLYYDICYLYVYLHDLYCLLNYFLIVYIKKQSSDDIYKCLWKYCLKFKLKMYHLRVLLLLMERLKCV